MDTLLLGWPFRDTGTGKGREPALGRREIRLVWGWLSSLVKASKLEDTFKDLEVIL